MDHSQEGDAGTAGGARWGGAAVRRAEDEGGERREVLGDEDAWGRLVEGEGGEGAPARRRGEAHAETG